jgi:NAD(P)H-nitrite reductase large subunit
LIQAPPFDNPPPILKQNLDKNLCACNEVPKRDISNATVNGVPTVEVVKKQTYALKGNTTMVSGYCIQQEEVDCGVK